MANVKIDITVDTVKLLAEFPKGGELTNRSIVVMTDNQPDSIYKNTEGGLYKDKLTTATDPGDTIFWQIQALNKKDKLVLVKCNASEALKNMLSEQPSVDNADADKKWKAKLKNNLGKSVCGFYTFNFAFSNDLSKTWSWDPNITSRPPQ
jgi:hypothetical protein